MSLREYLMQQIDASGALQKLMKFPHPDDGQKVLKLALDLEKGIVEDKAARKTEQSNSKLGTPIGQPMVKEIKQSRYAPDKLAALKEKEETISTSLRQKDEARESLADQTTQALSPKKSEKESTISPTLTPHTSTQAPEQPPKLETKADSQSSAQEEPAQPRKKREKESSSEDHSYQVAPSSVKLNTKLQNETESLPDDAESPMRDRAVPEAIPNRTIIAKDEDMFAGLLKKKKAGDDKPKEVTVNTEILSKMNSKIYSCISELQLEYMRNKSVRIQSAISTLSELRESIFQMQQGQKEGSN